MESGELVNLLRQKAGTIVQSWAVALKEMTGTSFEARRGLEELREFCAGLFRGYLEALERDSYDTIRQLVTEGVGRSKRLLGFAPEEGGAVLSPYPLAEALNRLIETFNLSEALRAFQTLRPIMINILKDEYRDERVQLTEAWSRMDDCLGMVALQFSEIYQGEVNQLLSGHLKQIEGLNSRLARLSITDGLTGVYNLRYFHYTLGREIRRIHRYGGSLSLALFDVDHFSEINESSGFETGDMVLQAVSGILIRSLRELDTVARYTGQQFVAILPETVKEGAALTAERVRREIERHPFSSGTGGEIKVTVSIGIAGDEGPDLDKQKLLADGEAALAFAKKQGGNQVATI